MILGVKWVGRGYYVGIIRSAESVGYPSVILRLSFDDVSYLTRG